LHRGRGDQALDLALAHRTFLFIWRGKTLYLLETMAACFAAVLVKGHFAVLLFL
jgi:hypothetical protein